MGDSTVPHLPVPLTSFIGRQGQIDELRSLLAVSRLLTLSGAGGSGKTRLAIEVTRQIAPLFTAGACYVDCAPLAHPDLVAVAFAQALGLPDQPGRSATDSLLNFIGDRQLLLVCDNCEHLLHPIASLIDVLLTGCRNVTVMTTSREPLGLAGETTWRVPSLSLDDEALTLFTDRARLVLPTFTLTDANRATIAEICRRLDGMPLALELAAARLRAMSPTEILEGLQHRFALLTGGARTAVPRQQTLRASVDWSHALLTPDERVLFRRLAVFVGGFDLSAAAATASGDGLGADQVLELLTQLIDKSLVMVVDNQDRTRYRLLETVREYAFERLEEAGECDVAQCRHRDFYAATASAIDALTGTSLQCGLQQAILELDNFRAAFAWSRHCADDDTALTIASSLLPLWLASGRILEGLAWFDAVLTNDHSTDLAPATRAAALADRALLVGWVASAHEPEPAELAVAQSRTQDNPALLARALTTRGIIAALHGEPGEQYFAEAAELARSVDDRWRLCQILGWRANMAFLEGDPVRVRAAASEGVQIADKIGDRFTSRQCRTWSSWAQLVAGDAVSAAAHFGAIADEARTDRDVLWEVVSGHYRAQSLSYQGDSRSAMAEIAPTVSAAEELGQLWMGNSRGVRAIMALADGRIDEADHCIRVAWESLSGVPLHQRMYTYVLAEVALARGDLIGARRVADEAVSSTTGWHRILSLTTRARVKLAEREPELCERDAYAALALAVDLDAGLSLPDLLECLAATACVNGIPRRSARLLGAADGMRRRMYTARFTVHDAANRVTMRTVRNTLGNKDFDAALAEGATLTGLEAIEYAQRGKGQRRRPSMGWGSLTPTEREVVRLVCAGLANKEIATRLLVSPRTVQTHLTHVYTKLNLTSRVQLVQEAGRHDD